MLGNYEKYENFDLLETKEPAMFIKKICNLVLAHTLQSPILVPKTCYDLNIYLLDL